MFELLLKYFLPQKILNDIFTELQLVLVLCKAWFPLNRKYRNCNCRVARVVEIGWLRFLRMRFGPMSLAIARLLRFTGNQA